MTDDGADVALAAVPDRRKKPRTVAERLADAQRAEAGPRKRVLELQGPYDAAAAAGRHQEAADLEPDLLAARQELLIAEASTEALRRAQEILDRERAQREAAADAERRRETAQAVIADALEAERAAKDGITRLVDLMWQHVTAAQVAFTEAQALEDVAGREYRRVLTARVAAGEMESVPGRLPKPNAASLLADQHQWLAEMLRWRR